MAAQKSGQTLKLSARAHPLRGYTGTLLPSRIDCTQATTPLRTCTYNTCQNTYVTASSCRHRQDHPHTRASPRPSRHISYRIYMSWPCGCHFQNWRVVLTVKIFLNRRPKSFKLVRQLSIKQDVISKVPQWSVIGSLLFLIFTNLLIKFRSKNFLTIVQHQIVGLKQLNNIE